jgi:hypothetical protein
MTTREYGSKGARAFARTGAAATLAILAGCGTPPRSDAPSTAAPSAAAVVIEPRPGSARLARAENPLARPAFDQGRLDPEKRIANLSLFFSLSPEQRKDRDALVAAQLDPASPSYHRWLTPETYRARFGARPEDLERASLWLASQGFDVHRTSRLGTRVTFSAKVADLEAAFQTEMHRYRVGSDVHYAMATAPAFPNDLIGVVLGLHNTHDFYPRPISRRTNAGAYARRAPVTPDYTISFQGGPDGGFQVLGPPDWATAYDVAKLYEPGIAGKKLDGTGVTVGIVGTAAIAQSDIDAFRTRFGLPARTVTMTLVPDTGASAAGQYGAGVEAILDVEWSGGIAKGADVHYVYVGEDDENVDDATFYLIEENMAPVMSESYGGCEAGSLATDADVLEENGTAANLLGITYMAAAGDDGAADCVEEGLSGLYVDMPGSFPGVTSVGGTQFPTPKWSSQGNLTSAGLEQVWNEGSDPYTEYMGQPIGVGAGGGGISSVFLRPAYQSAVLACNPVGTLPLPATAPMRQVPDVALSAASETPGYYIECTFDNSTQDCAAVGGMPFGTPIGGTSASSPSFAGFVAILNQAVGERLGNINPILYQLAARTTATPPFHDIVSGTNEIVCGEAGAGDAGGPDGGIWPDAGCGEGGLYGYVAAPSYDCASGIGSIDGFNLVSAWLGAVKTETVIVPTPDQTSEGAEVTLTATVNVEGANANALTGDVTFAFESYTASGATDLAWELGTVVIADGTVSSGQVVLSTTVPPGIVKPGNQSVDVVAFYGGDANHLPSTSAKVSLHFAPLSFAIVPAVVTLQPNAPESFATTGGVPPVRWFITADTTATFTGNSYESSSIGEGDGGFVAGPTAGYVEIQALDSFGAEAVAEVTVGAPSAPPPWADAGVDSGVRDAGIHDTGAHEAGHVARDASIADAGHPHDALSDHGTDAEDVPEAGGAGCTCELAKGRSGSGDSSRLAFVGVACGLILVARRRHVRR